MLRSPRYAALVAALAAAMAIFPATSQAGMQFGGEVFGGFNTHTMGDWNDIIDESNGFGSNFDNIENGFSFGLGALLMVNETWEFGAHYERLMPPKSEDQGTEVKTVANAFGASVAYLFPTKTPIRFGLQAGVDYMSLGGSISDTTQEFETEGSGVGFLFSGLARYRFNPIFSGQFSAGYRVADVEIDNIGGQDVSSQGLESEDYSGAVLRVGLMLHAPLKP